MRKIKLFFAIGLTSVFSISASARGEIQSNWPDFKEYTSVFKNPGQPGLDYIFTQAKTIPANQRALPITPLKVTTGEGVDTYGSLLKYRVYTQCFLTVGSQYDHYHRGITLKPGHRFYTEDEQETYGDTGGDNFAKVVTNNNPPYTYELKSKYIGDIAISLFTDKPLIGHERVLNDCMSSATASPINPGFCRILFTRWEAGFDVVNDTSVVRLICERTSIITFESDKSNFNVSPEIVKKTYSISNQEANALLAGAGIKLTKARKE